MTTDIEGAKAFYADVLRWDVQNVAPGTPYTLFSAGGVTVSGLSVLPQEAINAGFTPGWLGYVGVDDVDAVAERIQHLGGTLYVPPKEIPEISRFAIAADPQMATFAVLQWLKPSAAQPGELDAPGRVGWHELIAADWEKAWDFYRELFGWRKSEADTGKMGVYQCFSAAGITTGGMFTTPAKVPLAFWLYYFNVDDIDLAGNRVNAGGGQILEGLVEVPGNKWMLQCMDPQGAMFALVGRRRHDIGYFERVPPSVRR
jgi:predicted enzyme related to lactoylglutathione lyase